MAADSTSAAVAYNPAPVTQADPLVDEVKALGRRLDAFMVEMREWCKDVQTVVRVHHGRGLDNEERITAIENGFAGVKADIAKIEKAAARRIGRKRTK